MADRAKREKKAKLDKLAELKRAREGGGRSWDQDQDTDLYDEVSEEQYKRIVKGRLAKDDFVVDDGIGGYNDNGMDDWDGQNEAADSDEDDHRSAKCVSLRWLPLIFVYPDRVITDQQRRSRRRMINLAESPKLPHQQSYQLRSLPTVQLKPQIRNRISWTCYLAT